MDDGAPASSTDELRNAFDDLKSKNNNLRQAIAYIKEEEYAVRCRYTALNQKLKNLTVQLQKNAKFYNELFHNVSSTLEMGRISLVNSPANHLQKRSSWISNPKHRSNITTSSPMIDAVKNDNETKLEDAEQSPVPGPSRVASLDSGPNANANPKTVTTRRLILKPINMEELRGMIETEQLEENLQQNEHFRNDSDGGRLSVIPEERSDVTKLQELTIRLSRLPADVMEQHLIKQSMSLLSNSPNNSSLKFSGSPFSRSVSKKMFMGRLGLLSPKTSNISRRKPSGRDVKVLSLKNERTSGGDDYNGKLVTPKREKRSCSTKENKSSPKQKATSRRSLKRSFGESLNSSHEGKRPKHKTEEESPNGRSIRKSKKIKVSSPVLRRRPRRKATPVSMKEPPLNKKLRRS